MVVHSRMLLNKWGLSLPAFSGFSSHFLITTAYPQLFLCLLLSFFRILAWISPTFKSSVTSLMMTKNILAPTLSYLWDVFLVSSTVIANSVSSDSNSLSPIPFLPSDCFSYSLDRIHSQASTLPNALGSPFQSLLVLIEV